MNLIERIYEDIHDHREETIVAIAMNHHTASMISAISSYTMSIAYTRPRDMRFHIFGYPVALIDEIPPGEWLVVCEDRSAWQLYDWKRMEATFTLFERSLKGKPL